MVVNFSSLSDADFAAIVDEVGRHRGLNEVLAWAATKSKADVHQQFVSDLVTQDEFTHDVIVPYKDIFLVYDTT